MMQLAEILAKAKGGPIQYEGHEVRMILHIPIQKGDVFKLKWIRWNDAIRQGVDLGIPGEKKQRYGGEILIAGQRLRAPRLWVDTAPKEVEFTCFPKGKSGELGIWNIWQGKWSVNSWLCDAGLYVETPSDDTWIFHCSDGLGGVSFDDLVFELKRIHPSSQMASPA